jgi:beta-lactam-binding protein with PASTA domain
VRARFCPNPNCKRPQPLRGGDFCDACDEFLGWAPPGRDRAAVPGARAQSGLGAGSADGPGGQSTPETRGEAPEAPHVLPAVIALLDEGEEGGALSVEPGRQLQITGRVRNQSGIVDGYDLEVEELPGGWWTIEPPTIYLLPSSADTQVEEEFKVLLQPPRSPEARAGIWPLTVAAQSHAYKTLTVKASKELRIASFEDLSVSWEHEHTSTTGRWRGHLVATVANASNHDVRVSLSVAATEDKCHFDLRAAGTSPLPGLEVWGEVPEEPPRAPSAETDVTGVLPPGGGAARGQGSGASPPERSAGTGVLKLLSCRRRSCSEVLEVNIPRGHKLWAHVFVRPKEPLLVGRPHAHQLHLRATPTGGEGGGGDRKAPPPPATFNQRAWLPWWSSLLLIPVLVWVGLHAQAYFSRVRVPEVVGDLITTAREDFAKHDVRVLEQAAVQIHKTSACKTNYPARTLKVGVVFAEEPCAGSLVDRHSTVTLLTTAERHPARVPDLHDLSVEAAQESLRAAGFALGTIEPPSPSPGLGIVEQQPAQGGKVPGPKAVNVVLKKVAPVPNLIGQQPAAAAETLRAADLTLGEVSPANPHSGEVIVRQSPTADVVMPAGRAVEVWLGVPVRARALAVPAAGGRGTSKASKATPKAKAKASSRTKPPPTPVPALGSVAAAAAAAVLAKAGIVSRRTLAISATVLAGRVVRSDPPAGAKLRPGQWVTLVVSAGFPEVAVDDGHSVFALDGVTGKRVASIAAGPQPATEPSWSPDGRSVAYVSEGRVMLTSAHGAGGPVALTPAGEQFALPTFPSAPSAPAVLAAIAAPAGGPEELCLLAAGHGSPSCIPQPGWTLGEAIAWSPTGRELLVEAAQATPSPGVVGLLQFSSRVPFSTRAADWGAGGLATPTTAGGAGVLAGALAPNGATVALVEDFAGAPAVALAASSDLALAKATRLTAPQSPCAVQWRADGAELLVQSAGSEARPAPGCGTGLGTLYRVDPARPGALTFLAAGVAHPSWQPLPGVPPQP